MTTPLCRYAIPINVIIKAESFLTDRDVFMCAFYYQESIFIAIIAIEDNDPETNEILS